MPSIEFISTYNLINCVLVWVSVSPYLQLHNVLNSLYPCHMTSFLRKICENSHQIIFCMANYFVNYKWERLWTLFPLYFISFPEDLSLKEEKVKTLVSWSSFWLVFQTISLREAQSHWEKLAFVLLRNYTFSIFG